MITQLRITDFKAFHALNVAFAPLTILLGPNNSGKSSVIAPLRLLAQTSQSGDPGLPLLLDGPMGDFGTFRDMVHGNHRGRPMKLGLSVNHHDVRAAIDAEFKYRTQRRELVVREAILKLQDDHVLTATLSSDSQRHVISRLGGHSVPAPQRSAVSDFMRMRHFVPQIWQYPRRRYQATLATAQLLDRIEQLEDDGDRAYFAIVRALLDVEYLSAMRQPPERTYHQTGAASTRVGQTGGNWAGLFVLDAAKAGRSRQIIPGLTQWLRKAGLAADIRLNWLSDRHYEVQVKHPLTREYQNLADVGQANSQVIPVLVGGFRLRPGSTYLVEEPEIHLHPAAQASLGDFFVDLVGRGVNSVVETHSEYLVLRLQQHVAAGRLRPDQISFLYVDATPTKKRVRRLRLDETARFDRPLEGGFFPQRLGEARQLARLRGAASR